MAPSDPGRDDLRRWRYFVVLAEELHFTRAAARLRIAQPALSQQIRALERQLGGPLLHRDSHGCALTGVGEQVAAEARRLLADVDAAFVRPPVPEPGLSCRTVDAEELLLAVPARHRLAAGACTGRRWPACPR